MAGFEPTATILRLRRSKITYKATLSYESNTREDYLPSVKQTKSKFLRSQSTSAPHQQARRKSIEVRPLEPAIIVSSSGLTLTDLVSGGRVFTLFPHHECTLCKFCHLRSTKLSPHCCQLIRLNLYMILFETVTGI